VHAVAFHACTYTCTRGRCRRLLIFLGHHGRVVAYAFREVLVGQYDAYIGVFYLSRKTRDASVAKLSTNVRPLLVLVYLKKEITISGWSHDEL
jgi:hypothetical protein